MDISYFFRYQTDGVHNISMLLARLLFCVGMLVAYQYRHHKCLLDITLYLGLFLQVVMFIWYAGDQSLFLKEGLPFYHCRLSACMLVVCHLLHKPKLERYFAWLGLLGACIAFIFPDPCRFLWPHITNITYVGTHVLLSMSSLMILMDKKTMLSIRDILTVTGMMNLGLSIVNRLIQSNYGYLQELPKMFPFHFSAVTLYFVLTILITILIAMMEMTSYLIRKVDFRHDVN
ncbi:MAG: YwaF family protein [Erysipelotrichaceae bacterium]|nr:YwaF family protein [Erysipelotrichaceae bacterium]MDY6034566.1 YwaF family protein [Bulleidia sp.]